MPGTGRPLIPTSSAAGGVRTWPPTGTSAVATASSPATGGARRRARPRRPAWAAARRVEVKARRTEAFGPAAAAVGPVKQQRLRRLAAAWLAENGARGVEVRFDVVAVTGCIDS